MAKQKKFVIIDSHALIHRAWHALPPTLTTRDGEVVNAVYGFTSILLKVLKDLKPDYIAAAFDLAAPTFRHKEFQDYKATRVKQADELYEQIPRIRQVLEAFNIPVFEQEGFEADDIIATIVRDKRVEAIQSIIVTGDMDALQLVDHNTQVYTMRKGISDTLLYDIEQVKERYGGLTPEQIVDYKALRGDASDNIPGVKGVGEKTAIQLLLEFKTLNGIYDNIESETIKDRYRELLKEYKDDAYTSQRLAQMVDDVSIDFKLEDAHMSGYRLSDVVPLFQELEFKSLIGKLPKELQLDAAPGQSAFSFDGVADSNKIDSEDNGYILVNTDNDFAAFYKQLVKQKIVAFDTETAGQDPFTAPLLGMSFSWQENHAYYVAVDGQGVDRKKRQAWLDQLQSFFEDPEIGKVGHNIKFDIEVMQATGVAVAGVIFDTMIASYLINPGSRQHSLDTLAFSEFGYQMQPITDLIGKGKSQITLAEVSLERVSDYACEDADFTWRLYKVLEKELVKVNNLGLLDTIEVPLIPVLARMERHGVLVDTDFLNDMSGKVGKKVTALEAKIHSLAGEQFNVASPKQLKEILFEKLEIPTDGLGRTKTGISTAAAELEKLRGRHKIIDLIMEYRELTKLKSTYLDALPELVDAESRIHTSYNQTIAATGRLSSSDPNLQNIPIRTELGQQIRKAFIAPRGYQLIAADYSQIELRVIASLANDAKMIEAFEKGEDIHARTAAEIHDVPLEKVTKEMRYAAKAINFGIIYGQGPWGLAASAGISRERAAEFIERYFTVYHAIYDYLEETKEMAREHGYVETFFGRRRYVPEINANMQAMRAAAERAAINHPIQGTAADLLKLAMIEIDKELASVSEKSAMILQVHDELVFEVPTKEVDKVAAFVREKMEGIYELRAPVETHLSVGKNWGSMRDI